MLYLEDEQQEEQDSDHERRDGDGVSGHMNHLLLVEVKLAEVPVLHEKNQQGTENDEPHDYVGPGKEELVLDSHTLEHSLHLICYLGTDLHRLSVLATLSLDVVTPFPGHRGQGERA